MPSQPGHAPLREGQGGGHIAYDQASSGSNPEGFRSIEKDLESNPLATGDLARKDEGDRAVWAEVEIARL
jgi:hypothetical protein